MPPTRNNAQTNWAFTSYDEDPPSFLDNMRYLIYGRETCPTTGRKHWQCYTQLKKKVRFNTLKNLLDGDYHIEACRGSPNENVTYCKKEGDWTEHGEPPVNAGARTDLEGVVQLLNDGSSLDDLMLDPTFMEVIARHMQFFRHVSNNILRTTGLGRLQVKMAAAVLKPWQDTLLATIIQPAHDRHVYWVWCSSGGSGKSFMADYLVALHNAVVFTNGKVCDIAHAYNFEPVVIFDLARTQADKLDNVYMAIENFKNGRFFSPKYDSHTKVFAVPHVVCFANFPPEIGKLSNDRWKISELK